MKDKIEIYSSLDNSLKLVMLGGGFMMLGSSILDSSNTLVQILGLFIVLLGITSLIFGFLALVHIKPKITLNDSGIRDSIILKEFVNWNEVDKVELIYEDYQNKLLVFLKQQIEYSKFTFLYRNQKSTKSNQIDKKLKIGLGHYEVNYAELLGFLKEKNLYKME